MKIEIREMTLEDLPEVVYLEEKLFSLPWSLKGFQDSLLSSDTCYLVVCAGKKLAGYCGFLQSFDEADITNVAVDPMFQNCGIATQMLQRLMQIGNTRGIERYTLEVRVSNEPAIHVYEKLGFQSVGIRKKFYEQPVEDAMIMWTV